ncbi:MAG: 16S rRNA (guanine(527)-N(7))-methyltransferase RsmG [Chloroflexota bacterium]|nr:16S rRNA (guanine(527)-N(7))-methyltransferase RsmG [Chloroflexota bacterium]
MSGTDGAAEAARGTSAVLEGLLADAPAIASLLPPGYFVAIERYVALLLVANERLNLTRVVAPEAIARTHLLDALAALPLLDAWAPDRVIDLGSGGGVPAIPLALARPGMSWTLVDSVAKKADALREVVAALGLRDVAVLAERAETLGRDPRHRERYAVVTARACAALPVLAELSIPLVRVGGHLLAWKGPLTERDEELQRGRKALGEAGAGRPWIAETGLVALGGHRFVIATKERPTPVRFPRRPGEPGRRPLG